MNMARQVTALIQQYGQLVEVCRDGDVVECRGMLQTVKSAEGQYTYTPLGEENGQKILYLGEASVGISALGDSLRWQGKKYRFISAQPVYCGTDMAYWRGILKEVATECENNQEDIGEGEGNGDQF